MLQALVGLAVLLQFNRFAILLGIASLVVVAVYPFMKRITYWPQLVLGLAFSWGALMGWAAAFGDLDRPARAALCRLGPLGDRLRHDLRASGQGRRRASSACARRRGCSATHTKPWLVGLYGGALMLFACAFAAAEVPLPALAGLMAAGAHMARQIATLDINDPDQCLRLFKSNNVSAG